MPTVAKVPQDVPFVVGLASTFTVYPTYVAARDAAVALSAGNGNASVNTAQVLGQATNAAASGSPRGGRFDLVPGLPDAWIIQLAATATYLPEATAIAQAYTTSAANGNAPALVARCFQTVTAP